MFRYAANLSALMRVFVFDIVNIRQNRTAALAQKLKLLPVSCAARRPCAFAHLYFAAEMN